MPTANSSPATHFARQEIRRLRISRKNGGRQSRSIITGQTRISGSRLCIPAAPVTREISAKKPGQLKYAARPGVACPVLLTYCTKPAIW